MFVDREVDRADQSVGLNINCLSDNVFRSYTGLWSVWWWWLASFVVLCCRCFLFFRDLFFNTRKDFFLTQGIGNDHKSSMCNAANDNNTWTMQQWAGTSWTRFIIYQPSPWIPSIVITKCWLAAWSLTPFCRNFSTCLRTYCLLTSCRPAQVSQ